MRPVEHYHLRRAANLAELDASNAAIVSVSDVNRADFLNEHEPECSKLRAALWAIGHMKCWYSEAALQECEGHVEHYRPKRRLSGTAHAGYWWLAFDWKNLRLAHPTVNRRKTDYLTGKLVGKGSYFPLRDEATRAVSSAQQLQEEPVLLDPVVPSDTRLLCFAEASGAPRPRYSAEKDPWLNSRAARSIDYYHLDEGTWNAKRADLMAEVKKLCEQLEDLAVESPRDDVAYNEKIDEIVTYIGPFSEFSAACLQVVNERGLLDHFVPGLA